MVVIEIIVLSQLQKLKKLGNKILEKERELADKYLLGQEGKSFRKAMIGGK